MMMLGVRSGLIIKRPIIKRTSNEDKIYGFIIFCTYRVMLWWKVDTKSKQVLLHYYLRNQCKVYVDHLTVLLYTKNLVIHSCFPCTMTEVLSGT